MAVNTPVGIEFTETMKGFVQRGSPPELSYVDAERAGQRAGTRAEFTLTISIPSLDDFLADRAHTGSARGTVHVDGFTGAEGAGVTSGVFNLFGNLSTITTPAIIGILVARTGTFNSALVFVGLTALVAIFSYLVIVGEIRRLELNPQPAVRA